ncbi:N-acetyl-gamma-glutamyl-phosphate reductase [Pelagibacterales bacterium SAG-MED39]|nr:N-acetyl-gamma-glutamyl-phosphate reductase [Pelagibacterales bacterium SAG-MED39]
MRKLNALIAGSTGYIGVQLVKLLVRHKNVNIKYLCGNTSVGKKLSFFDKSLKSKKLPKIINYNNKLLKNVDLIFTALPNGEAQAISKNLLKTNTLIDLAADFRLKKSSEYFRWYKQKHKAIYNIKKSIYALPEITGKKVTNYNIIGCPGCYPTSVLLPLIPLIQKKSISTKNIIIDSKSGYSGAGRGIHKKHKKEILNESLSAYGLGFHRHNSEIDQELKDSTKSKINFIFTPHLVPMFRGILSTIYVNLRPGYSIKKIQFILKQFHKKNRFVKILNNNSLISTNDVVNSNNCFISVCQTKYKNKVIILSAIDNLIKGGSGQAIQNMNLKFGFDKNEGLR